MKITVSFFENDFNMAIGAGIYRVSVILGDKTSALYIGESVFVLVRCATHLFELKRNPEYWGFDKEKLENEHVVLRFELIEPCADMEKRKKREKILISTEKPIMQNGISDRMKSIDEKLKSLEAFFME